MKWLAYHDGIDFIAISENEKKFLIKLNEILDDKATHAYNFGGTKKIIREESGELILRLEN